MHRLSDAQTALRALHHSQIIDFCTRTLAGDLHVSLSDTVQFVASLL